MTVWKYGDDINTDMLFPGKYTYSCATPSEILPHLLEDLDVNFAKAAAAGDILMAGRNFGCGSSREQPAVGFKAIGLEAIIAAGFARIFYRAAINQGLLLIECAAAVAAYMPGDAVVVAPIEGRLTIGKKEFSFPKLPAEILAIREAGGLLAYIRRSLAARQAQ